MSECIFKKEGVVASYPYEFSIYQDGDTGRGVVHAYLYENIVLDNEAQKEQLASFLNGLSVQDGCHYEFRNGTIVYVSEGPVDLNEDRYAAEIRIRRHFIEDFLETDDDILKEIAPYPYHSLKTEFTNI